MVNAGGTLASNNTFNTLVNPTLAGGTLLLNGGALAAFPAFAIKGTLTVSGTAASNINVGSGSNNVLNIGTNVGGGVTTFDVGDVTLSAATDLTINAPLKNNMNVAGNAEVASGLTKTGAGTLLLATANTHSGTTTVSGGTLALGNVNALTASTLDTGTAGSQNVAFTVAGSNTYQINGLAGSDALNIGANSLSLAELGGHDELFGRPVRNRQPDQARGRDANAGRGQFVFRFGDRATRWNPECAVGCGVRQPALGHRDR